MRNFADGRGIFLKGSTKVCASVDQEREKLEGEFN